MDDEREAARRLRMLELTADYGKVFLLPDETRFDRTLDSHGPWSERSEPLRGRALSVAPASPGPMIQLHVELGPFCLVERPERRHALAAWPTDLVTDALAPHLAGMPGETYEFSVWVDGEWAVVGAQSMLVIGSLWLAFVETSSVPNPGVAARRPRTAAVPFGDDRQHAPFPRGST